MFRAVVFPRGGSKNVFLRAARYFSDLPEHRIVTMPKVSPTMEAGRLIEWKKREGDPFGEDEEIAEVESDKSTMPITARDEGFIARIFVSDDTPDLLVGTPIALTVEEEKFIPAFKSYQVPGASPPVSKPIEQPVSAAKIEIAPSTGRVPSIVFRYAAKKAGNASSTSVSKTDWGFQPQQPWAAGASTVQQVATPRSAVVASEQSTEELNYEDKSVSTMRRAIAKHVVLSKQTIPHQYSTVEFQLDELLSFRKRLNSDVEDNVRVSVNDIFIRAAAIALTQVPEMNVRFDPVSGEAVANSSADISFAVAIPDGLLLPVVFGAEQEGLSSIAMKTKDLALRARSGDLLQAEYEGGYFGISNLGMFGIDHFCAIVSPPQSGILAIGAGVPRMVPTDEGKLMKVTMGTATLSSDARVVGPETAAAFMETFSRCLINPENMML